jgi:hypothetical protein
MLWLILIVGRRGLNHNIDGANSLSGRMTFGELAHSYGQHAVPKLACSCGDEGGRSSRGSIVQWAANHAEDLGCVSEITSVKICPDLPVKHPLCSSNAERGASSPAGL